MGTVSINNADSALSILVVDDDELNQRLMRIILKREGHLVECASNGVEAVDAVRSGKYDMILMDLQMPMMDGLEASRRIREWEDSKGHTFIVALTASFLPEKGKELYEAGIDNYLAKPFEIEHLRHILQYGTESRKSRLATGAKAATEDVPEFDFQVGLQRVGGNSEVFKELLSDFVEELPGKEEKLRVFYENKDMEELYRAAHNLKGVSANLGALQLSECAQRLEKQASHGYTESTQALLADVSTAVRKFIEAAVSYLAGGSMKAAETL